MNQSPSVTIHYAQGILQAAERLGLALPPGLRELGREARIPLARQDELWEALCASSGDALIGLRLGSALQVGHLDMLGALLMSCETLGEALEALLEYYPIIGEGSDFSLERAGQAVSLGYRPSYQRRRAERVEAVLASLVHLTAWITGGRVRPQRLLIAHAAPAEVERYTELLGVTPLFDASVNALQFAPADLGVVLIQANAPMREHLRALADAQLQRLGAQSLAARVEQLLRAYPDWGKERIAEQLQLSGRHLNRKLAEQGSSFKLLREQVLYAMAERLLRESPRLADVAERLGFCDESAFAKAFRRWSGMTPGQFRQSLE
ncbi:AraC family transcriptional regulator [Pseudomonas panipatensis]|uniref:AraC-type DNA-binding protein n=1 Tax=Pseudomonas panipatensis TaxID=428992 RepID=A0A1G8LCX9_9PSED|nr:AraC family transcriptional regulator [Pseudomonas panipatensis]SDI53317.1 AraC-type DNA-binding protein [Pseudomonas panipatensis]SMP75220.1 AraC-type DNA-binding protein [Pseudomonas panipatensis]